MGQDSCVVKVQLCDCQNCYLGINQVNRYDTEIKKTLIFPNISKKEVYTYFYKVLNLDDTNNYKIIASDSIYNSISKNHSSEVVLFNNGKEEKRYLLKNSYKLLLNSKNKDTSYYKIDLKKNNIVLSGVITITKNTNYILITDYLFGNLIFINRNNFSFEKLFSNKDLNYEELFSHVINPNFSYDNYKKYKNLLKQFNFEYARFSAAQGITNQLIVLCQIPEIKVNNNTKEMQIIPITIPLKFNSPINYNIYAINNNSLPSGYSISSQSIFFNDSSAYLFVLPPKKYRDSTKNKYFLAKYDNIEDTSLYFKSFVKLNIPKEYSDNKIFNDLSFPVFTSKGFVFFRFSNVLYNINKNKKYKMPFRNINLSIKKDISTNSKVIKSDGYIYDVFQDKDKFYVLHSYKSDSMRKEYFLSTIDTNMNLIENHKIYDFPEFEKTKTNIYLLNKNFIIYIDKKDVVIKEKLKFEN